MSLWTYFQKVVNNPLGSYYVSADKATNAAVRQAVGIDIGDVDNAGLWTPSRVSLSNPLPTSPSTTDRNGTWTTSVVTGSSGTLLAANASRKRFSIVFNSTGYVYVKFGSGGSFASYNIILYPGGAYVSDLYEYAGVITYETSGAFTSHYIGEQV